MCGMTAVEDQKHMLVECDAYQHERIMMFETIDMTDETSSMNSSDKERLAVWLLSDVHCDLPVRAFLEAAFIKRSSWMGTH